MPRGAPGRSRTRANRDPADGSNPQHEALLADSVGLALLVILEALEPAERLAFVLHDMFAVPCDEIAPIVDRSPVAACQRASRARRRVQGNNSVPDADLSTPSARWWTPFSRPRAGRLRHAARRARPRRGPRGRRRRRCPPAPASGSERPGQRTRDAAPPLRSGEASARPASVQTSVAGPRRSRRSQLSVCAMLSGAVTRSRPRIRRGASTTSTGGPAGSPPGSPPTLLGARRALSRASPRPFPASRFPGRW